MTKEEPKKRYTVYEASKFLGLSTEEILKLVGEGMLETVKVSGSGRFKIGDRINPNLILFSEDVLEHFLKSAVQ